MEETEAEEKILRDRQQSFHKSEKATEGKCFFLQLPMTFAPKPDGRAVSENQRIMTSGLICDLNARLNLEEHALNLKEI